MALPLAVWPRSKALPIHSPYPYFLRLGLLGPGAFLTPFLTPCGFSSSFPQGAFFVLVPIYGSICVASESHDSAILSLPP
jgi:hypothetical protein